jgi:hypothetical protein
MPADASAARLQKSLAMKARLVSALDRERAAGFKNLSGTQLEVTVPITQRLVDLLVARGAARTRQLGGLSVTLRPGGVIGVAMVKPVLGFAARLGLDLRVRGAGDLASDPRLYLLVDRPSLAWSAISRIAVAAGLAPAGVEVGRDGVALDLRTLATRAGVGDLLPMARAVDFESDPGVLRVRVTVQVPEGGIAAEPPGRSAPATARTGEMVEVLPELRGARVRGRIVLTDVLVNEVLSAALDAAREAAPQGDDVGTGGEGGTGERGSAAPLPVDGRTVAHWIQRASVRFENGRVVLEPDIAIR